MWDEITYPYPKFNSCIVKFWEWIKGFILHLTGRVITYSSLLWLHNGRDGVSNHQPHVCLHNRSVRRRSKKTSKLRVTGLCAGNSPVTGEVPAQRASNAENVSIWWRHHGWDGSYTILIKSVTGQYMYREMRQVAHLSLCSTKQFNP